MDYMVVTIIIEDDKGNGTFWRKGERYLRSGDEESRLLNLAPELEHIFLKNIDEFNKEAKKKSLGET